MLLRKVGIFLLLAQRKAKEEVLGFKQIERKLSNKEVADELLILMNEHKDNLIIKDSEFFKQALILEDLGVLTKIFEEIQMTNEETKIISMLDSLLESSFFSKQ